jgi:alpha-methylacyl-CoA racemase
VVDAAVVDGVASLFTLIQDLRASGYWCDQPERNVFLGSCPFYDVFECADGKHITLGAIEPQFYRALLARLGIADEDPARQLDTTHWPELRARIADAIHTRTRAQWCAELEGSDVCFAPVLDLAETMNHPHHVARGNFVEVAGRTLPAPAPKFSRTRPADPSSRPAPGEHTAELLAEYGYSTAQIAGLRAGGACG